MLVNSRQRGRGHPTREIVLVKVGTDYNIADAFTNVLDVIKFEKFTAYILGEA